MPNFWNFRFFKSIIPQGLIIMKPLRKLSELRGILKEVERPAKEIVGELRKEWEIKLGELT